MVHLFKYVRSTKDLPFIPSAYNSGMLKWYIDGSYGVHHNTRGHTGGVLTMGRGLPIPTSIKQKLNTMSSTKQEMIGVEQLMPLLLWTRIFQNIRDMKSLIISYIKTIRSLLFWKRMVIHQAVNAPNILTSYIFVTDRIYKGDMSVEWCPTCEMTIIY